MGHHCVMLKGVMTVRLKGGIFFHCVRLDDHHCVRQKGYHCIRLKGHHSVRLKGL